MTPAEVLMSIEVRNRMQQKWILFGSWHTAALQRVRKMPSLRRLLRAGEQDDTDYEQLKRDHEELLARARGPRLKEKK